MLNRQEYIIQLLKEGQSTILFLGYGNGVGKAVETATLLQKEGVDVAIVDLRFVKPLDEVLLVTLAQRYKQWYVFRHARPDNLRSWR